MNQEMVSTIAGLLGGLAVFIYGMNLMSEGLQKAAGEKMKKILSVLTKNPLVGMLAGALVTAVQLGDHRYGHRLCQCRTDDAAAGDFGHLRRQYRYDDDCADYRVQH